MKLKIDIHFGVGLLCLITLAGSGCQSDKKSQFFMPKTYGENMPPSSGSIAEMKEKAERKAAKDARKAKKPGQLEPVVVLVQYDSEGKPTGIDLRQSSGDAAVDRKAIEQAFTKTKYPRGKADTVLITIDPKTVPKSN